jgi:hypothetical protein
LNMRTSIIDVALRCYPKWWTERYGEEMRAVIDDLENEGRSRKLIAVGLLRDALRSRLQARGMPRTYGLLANRTKTSVAASTLPWMAVVPFVGFITGRFVLHSSSGFVEKGYPFQLTLFRTRVQSTAGTHWVHPSMSTATWVVGISTMVITGLFVVTLMMLGFGLGSLRKGIDRERSRNRRSMYLLTWVPPVTLLAIFVFEVAQLLLNGNGHFNPGINGHISWAGGHPALAALMGNLMWTTAISGWLVTMGGLAVVANRVNLPPATLRFGRTVSVLTSISMTLTLVAFVIWVAALHVQSSQVHVAGSLASDHLRVGVGLCRVNLRRDASTTVVADHLFTATVGEIGDL